MNLKDRLKENNLHLKLLSIAVAILFWSFVMGVVNPDISANFRNVEVEINGIQMIESNGMAYISPENPLINVKISGPRSEINQIRNENVEASINVSNLDVGKNKVPIEVSIRNFYGVVNIEDIEPAYIEVLIENIESKLIPIEIEVDGNLAEDYILGEVKPLVEEVEIKGPSSQIDSVQRAVAKLDISEERNETFVVSSEIEFYDRDGEVVENVESDIDVVEIEVPISKAKSVPISVDFTGSLPENHIIEDVEVEPENVVIAGSEEILKEIDTIKTEPIDYSSLQDKSFVETGLVLPDGVKLKDENSTVRVKYELTDSISKTLEIPSRNIKIENKDDDYNYDIESENILVELYGDNKAIAEIKADDVELYINVKDLPTGQYQLYIKYDNDNIRQLDPNKIDVSISEK